MICARRRSAKDQVRHCHGSKDVDGVVRPQTVSRCLGPANECFGAQWLFHCLAVTGRRYLPPDSRHRADAGMGDQHADHCCMGCSPRECQHAESNPVGNKTKAHLLLWPFAHLQAHYLSQEITDVAFFYSGNAVLHLRQADLCDQSALAICSAISSRISAFHYTHSDPSPYTKVDVSITWHADDDGHQDEQVRSFQSAAIVDRALIS